MAYDLKLESRIDKAVDDILVNGKKKMFGGICYLVNGNMSMGIHKDYLIIRTTPERAEKLMEDENISVFDITGRPMKGLVMASSPAVENNEDLVKLLKEGIDFAMTLPPK